ncbi:MAG: hypothetical protein EP311_02735 [Cytophagales bacterium]|nr:MAG: hypothetical protein EP311_02735 [Cytophagales bacterium]
MKRFLLKIFSYLILVFLIGNIGAWSALKILGRSYFYKPNFIVNHFEGKGRFDYVIAGSSRGLTTINTEEVDRQTGLKGLNISMDDTGLPSQFLMIKHFFESGNQADRVILTLDLGHFEESEQMLNDNDYRFVSYSHRDYIWEYFYTYEKGVIRPLTLSNYFPVFAIGYYNLELVWPAGLSLIKPTYTNRFDWNGNYSYPNSSLQSKSEEIQWEIIEKQPSNPILKEIESYLKQKNSQLILYVGPYLGKQLVVPGGNGSDFPLINHSAIFTEAKYFFDVDHVNDLGKAEATQKFVEALEPFR